MTASSAHQPLFILGMLPRSGTNYVRDLVALHPDVVPLEPVHEDHLLRRSNLLLGYAEEVSRGWSPDWEVPTDERTSLVRSLGEGIVAWVASHAPDACVVTKMPSVERLANYPLLFAECPLVIVVRDGRSVVQSGVRSFGWTYEAAARRWAHAAEEVLAFDAANRDTALRYVIVRYEDLLDDLDTQLPALVAHAGLDPSGLDIELAKKLPVRGSSTLRADADAELHWRPVERDADFAPKERWSSWDSHRHQRFNAVAGDAQRRLGYEVEDAAGPSAVAARLGDAMDAGRERLREVKADLGRARRAVRHAIRGD